MNILVELWYGNIEPSETIVEGNRYYKKLLSLMGRNREDLCRDLTATQIESLEKYDDNIREMSSISEKEAFAYGFRLGMRLAVESLFEPKEEEA